MISNYFVQYTHIPKITINQIRYDKHGENVVTGLCLHRPKQITRQQQSIYLIIYQVPIEKRRTNKVPIKEYGNVYDQ